MSSFIEFIYSLIECDYPVLKFSPNHTIKVFKNRASLTVV